MALLTSQWRFATERYWYSLAGAGKWITSILGIAALGYLGWQEVRLGGELLALRRAGAAEKDSLAQATLYEAAHALEPSNGATAHRIAEIYRRNAFDGKSDYAELAAKAISWYQQGITNNPYDGYNYMRWGMVLDFLGEHEMAETLMWKADELDPNGYYTCAHMGRHYVMAGEYASARPWLERSLRLRWEDNGIAADNLLLANQRLLESAKDPLLRKLREQMRQLEPVE